MSNKPRRPAPFNTSDPEREIVAVALLDSEELANLTTGFRRVYALPDRGNFDDLLLAIEKASRRR